MNLTGWFRQQKIKQYSRQFWALIEQGEIKAALTLYESHLAPNSAQVGKPLRATYYFYRWLGRGEIEDFQAVQLMATHEPAHSQVARTAHTMRRFRRETNLAEALRQRRPDLLKAPAESVDFSASLVMENLALAILEIYQLEHKSQLEPLLSQTATTVQRLLPERNNLNGLALQVRDTLWLWAIWNQHKYSTLIQNIQALQALPKDDQAAFKLAVIYAWGQHELSQGQVRQALSALNQAATQTSTEQIQTMILSWGVNTFEKGLIDTTLEWFSYHHHRPTPDASPEWLAYLSFVLGVIYFQNKQYRQGREVLEHLGPLLAGNNKTAPAGRTEGRDSQELIAQVEFLRGLSLLAEATESFEEGPEKTAKNRATWGTVQGKLQPIIGSLSNQTSTLAWKGALLTGLLAYLDSSTTLSLEKIEQFSVAVEHLPSQSGQERLQAIASTLLTRAKATDEAMALVQSRDYTRLQALQEQVLAPLGNAIPSLVQVSVYMTLWEGNSAYDPLPDLQHISGASHEEELISQCISQVQVTNTLKRLQQLCLHPPSAGSNDWPSLAPLSFDIEVAKFGALGAAVAKLHQGNWAEALKNISHIESDESSDFGEMVRYTQFYAAWKMGDIQTGFAIKHQANHNRFLNQNDHWQIAVSTRGLINALEKGPIELAYERFIDIIAVTTETELSGLTLDQLAKDKIAFEHLLRLLMTITVWLLEHGRSKIAITLFDIIRQKVLTGIDSPTSDLEGLKWLLSFLNGLAAAQAEQYIVSIDAFDQILSQPAPLANGISPQLVSWAKLLKLEAELALVSQATDDVKQRWPSVRRSLEEQVAQLKDPPIVQVYGFLVLGLVSYLSADILIDDEVLQKFAYTQRVLPMQNQARFVEGVIGQLVWRKRIIEEFWGRLSSGQFKASRLMYKEQLEPAFGERMPHSFQLAMIMADWDANIYTTPELLQRLTVLEHDAPELSRELTQKVRDYILDGDKIRRLTQLVKDEAFEAIIEFVQNTEWAGLNPGAMPVPAAIALLYAYQRKKKTEEAQRLGEIIRQSQGLDNWVKDYGLLLLGYVLFDKKEYRDAATAFEKVSKAQLLGHDVDKYWAASHFSRGMQLLVVDNKKDAFDAFVRSLNKRGTVRENVNLVPLFVHFGLQHIESRNGSRAKAAFRHMAESLEGLSDSADVCKHRLLAQMGQLLCEAHIEPEPGQEVPGGGQFQALVDQLDQMSDYISKTDRPKLERVFRVMAICQTLKKEHNWDRSKLYIYLTSQIKAMEKLGPVTGQHDPVLSVLKGLVELRLKEKGVPDQALESFKQAIQLGIQSPALTKLIESQIKGQQQASKTMAATLDLFDIYLLAGEIPADLKDSLVRNDDIAELYRLNRNYTPADIGDYNVQTSVAVMCQRLEDMIKQVQENGLKDDPKLKGLSQQVEKQVKEIKNLEDKLLESEKQIMEILAQKLRQQTLDTAR